MWQVWFGPRRSPANAFLMHLESGARPRPLLLDPCLLPVYPPLMPLYSLGLDFGTESIRALLVDISNGKIAAQATSDFAHGVIDQAFPGSKEQLPPDYALQHPLDWLQSASSACKSALRGSNIDPKHIVGLGLDFTSCTMLPTLRDGIPLCLLDDFKSIPLSWPKL